MSARYISAWGWWGHLRWLPAASGKISMVLQSPVRKPWPFIRGIVHSCDSTSNHKQRFQRFYFSLEVGADPSMLSVYPETIYHLRSVMWMNIFDLYLSNSLIITKLYWFWKNNFGIFETFGVCILSLAFLYFTNLKYFSIKFYNYFRRKQVLCLKADLPKFCVMKRNWRFPGVQAGHVFGMQVISRIHLPLFTQIA